MTWEAAAAEHVCHLIEKLPHIKGEWAACRERITPAPEPEQRGAMEIDNRVQVQVSGDSRVRVVTLTANGHDPDLGYP